MIRKFTLTVFTMIAGLILAACTTPIDTASPTAQSKVVNPASAYCQENGGTLAIRDDDAGSQHGVCVFPDQSECDEWTYYRGDCQPGDSLQPSTPAPVGAADVTNPASKYCEANGGTVDLRQDASGAVQGMCVFPDNTECEEWAYYRDECQLGTPTP